MSNLNKGQPSGVAGDTRGWPVKPAGRPQGMGASPEHTLEDAPPDRSPAPPSALEGCLSLSGGLPREKYGGGLLVVQTTSSLQF